MKFKSTGWEITGSSGVSAKIETPVANIGIGASYIRLPIENSQTKQKVMLQGVGGGVGVGLSISTPVVSVSGSLDQFPADGIGKIIEGTSPLEKVYRATDFFGEILVFSLSGGKQISGQLSGILWLKEPVERCISSLNCSPAELKMIARKTLLKMAGVAPNPVGKQLNF